MSELLRLLVNYYNINTGLREIFGLQNKANYVTSLNGGKFKYFMNLK